MEALRKRKSSLKTEGLSAKRKASFQTSEMTKENYDKMGLIQIRQLRSESLPNKTQGNDFISDKLHKLLILLKLLISGLIRNAFHLI